MAIPDKFVSKHLPKVFLLGLGTYLLPSGKHHAALSLRFVHFKRLYLHARQGILYG